MSTPEVQPNEESIFCHCGKSIDDVSLPHYLSCAPDSGFTEEEATDMVGRIVTRVEGGPLLPVSKEDEPVDVFLPGGRYYGRWITIADHDVTLACSCGYKSGVEDLPPVLDRAADELHRGH